MLPDVLDAMGKTPREFAGIHVHFESLQRVDGTRFIVSLLFQSAFDPVPRASVLLSTLTTARTVLSLALPSLEGGRVVRLRTPVRLSEEEAHDVGVRLEGPEPKGARVRPAWKLFDTVQSARDLPRGNDRVHGIGWLSFFFSMIDVNPIEAPREIIPARALEPALRGPLIDGTATPQSDTLLDLLWRPGQPVPEAAVVRVSPPEAPEPVRWCRECGFEGPRREHEKARACPQCDAPWV